MIYSDNDLRIIVVWYYVVNKKDKGDNDGDGEGTQKMIIRVVIVQ